MFRGCIYFKYTPHGYVIDDFIELENSTLPKITSYKFVKHMRFFGEFNFMPVKGQYCKRPHKLIEWSK